MKALNAVRILVHSVLIALVLGLVVGLLMTAFLSASRSIWQPASAATSTTATIPSRGDVTNDGRINAADALLILQFDAGLIAPLDAISRVRGDVNRDGRVSPIDAALVLQLEAGIIGAFAALPATPAGAAP